MYHPFKRHFLGISPGDGSIDFYLRVNSLVNPQGVYLDYGAGRGRWFEDDVVIPRLKLRDMRGKFAEVIAADVDPIVFSNKSADKCILIENGRLPLEDKSVDVIVADYVIEHVLNPKEFSAELSRVLKPNGWFCARTPHKAHYIVWLSKMIPGALEEWAVKKAQPDRKSIDVFPKFYRLNTLHEISEAFPYWKNYSFNRREGPAYYFGLRSVYWLIDFIHRFLPTAMIGNIFVFMQKPGEN